MLGGGPATRNDGDLCFVLGTLLHHSNGKRGRVGGCCWWWVPSVLFVAAVVVIPVGKKDRAQKVWTTTTVCRNDQQERVLVEL